MVKSSPEFPRPPVERLPVYFSSVTPWDTLSQPSRDSGLMTAPARARKLGSFTPQGEAVMFDIPSSLVLVTLIALFGFLATRAWRLKNGLLKWGGVVLSSLLTLIPLLVLALALVGFVKINQHYSNAAADVHVAGTPAQLARGAQLAHICASCHSPNADLPLSGVNFQAKFG